MNNSQPIGKKEKCLVPDCNGTGSRRGLCSSCRNSANREIESGRTTEQELIEQGLLNPKTRKARLAIALDAKRQKQQQKKRGKSVEDFELDDE